MLPHTQKLMMLKKIKKFVKNRKELLFNLKLPEKLFANSSMIDFGCGTGQNSLVYDELGSNCTLVEYDKKSYHECSKLFKKYLVITLALLIITLSYIIIIFKPVI